MPQEYVWRFKVRSYEIDTAGCVHNSIYLNYLEEGATLASADVGYPRQWYLDRRVMWVIRKLELDLITPATFNDELELTTWISDTRRVQSHREYVLRRTSDDQTVLRARVNWVFVNNDTQLPSRLPAEFDSSFQPGTSSKQLPIHIQDAEAIENSTVFRTTRQVVKRDIDSMLHANNANYIEWSEQALYDSFAQAGWSANRLLGEENIQIRVTAHEMEYLQSAQAEDTLVISSRLYEQNGIRQAWLHEIRHSQTDILLARDYSVVQYIDPITQAVRQLPAALTSVLTTV